MNIAFYIFAAIFAIGVVVNFSGPKKIKQAYAAWGLPGWFRFLTGGMELVALILVFSPFALLGYLTAAVVMAGAIFIMVTHKSYKEIMAPGLTLLLIIFLFKDLV